jgi:hypothetical protein
MQQFSTMVDVVKCVTNRHNLNGGSVTTFTDDIQFVEKKKMSSSLLAHHYLLQCVQIFSNLKTEPEGSKEYFKVSKCFYHQLADGKKTC